MIIGAPKEIKKDEYRVAITPAGVRELVANGQQVLIERGAGTGSAVSDAEFVAAGATILESADELWAGSDMVLKVKEPIEDEYSRLAARKNQVLLPIHGHRRLHSSPGIADLPEERSEDRHSIPGLPSRTPAFQG
jgi:alanine dehydrogenase